MIFGFKIVYDFIIFSVVPCSKNCDKLLYRRSVSANILHVTLTPLKSKENVLFPSAGQKCCQTKTQTKHQILCSHTLHCSSEKLNAWNKTFLVLMLCSHRHQKWPTFPWNLKKHMFQEYINFSTITEIQICLIMQKIKRVWTPFCSK